MKRDQNGLLHCDDGPAVTSADGSFVWFKHGRIHREDGPAVRLVFSDRIEEQFWVDGVEQETCRDVKRLDG